MVLAKPPKRSHGVVSRYEPTSCETTHENIDQSASLPSAPVNMEELESMTKEQLIQELVKARITESRLEKQSFSGLHIVRAIRSGTTAGCLSMGDAKRDEADDRDQGGHDAHGPRPGSPVAEPADGPKDAGRDGNNEPQKCDGAE